MSDKMYAAVHSHQGAMDWAIASTLVGGAYAFHVDMLLVNQYLAFAGGILGVALGAARLYFFLRDRWDGRGPGVDFRSKKVSRHETSSDS